MKSEKKDRKGSTKCSSAFLLTLNQVEYFEELKSYLIELRYFQYMIACKEEAPTTGHKHIHIYVQFKRSTRLSIKKLLGAHCDKCYGTPQQNKAYVGKGDVIFEYGSMRQKGFLSIEEVKQMSVKDRNSLSLVYYNMVEKLNHSDEILFNTMMVQKNVKVYYISGVSGIGKTRFAHFLIGKETFNVVKYRNKFWMGVTPNVRVALYDDWRDTHMDASEFLNFIDYNKQIMNIKNNFIINNYTLIILTSVMQLEDIYKDAAYEDREQWTRRVKEIKLSIVRNEDRRKWIQFMCNMIGKYWLYLTLNKLKKYQK